MKPISFIVPFAATYALIAQMTWFALIVLRAVGISDSMFEWNLLPEFLLGPMPFAFAAGLAGLLISRMLTKFDGAWSSFFSAHFACLLTIIAVSTFEDSLCGAFGSESFPIYGLCVLNTTVVWLATRYLFSKFSFSMLQKSAP